jgi:hypothetical protein
MMNRAEAEIQVGVNIMTTECVKKRIAIFVANWMG